VSAEVHGLTPNTTYYFRVDATNAGGVGQGSIQPFTTMPLKPAVTTGEASPVGQTLAKLNGTVNPNGAPVTSCEIEYGTSPTLAAPVTVVSCGSPGSGSTPQPVSAEVHGLTPNTTYYFRVDATNAGGVGQGSIQPFTTEAAASPEAAVSLEPPAVAAQVGGAFSETATVTEGGVPISGVLVTFTVTGANPQTGVASTDSAGQATFSYTGTNAGGDHIVASFVDKAGVKQISNEVTKTWTASSGGASNNNSGGSSSSGGTTGSGSTGGGEVLGNKTESPPLPPPVLGKTVDAQLVSGDVFIKYPSGAQVSLAGPWDAAFESLSKGLGFVPLVEARQIPVGSILETTHGVVKLTTATAAAGKFGFGDFGAGIFKLLQNRRQRGLTELDIVDSRSPRQVCATLGKRASVASRRLPSTVLGRLNSSDHGKFTARGQYSAATVRGTEYTVTNECAGTLTQVRRGEVSVRDFVRRKTITLFAGQHYLAQAP
jgi:hypothetical protein